MTEGGWAADLDRASVFTNEADARVALRANIICVLQGYYKPMNLAQAIHIYALCMIEETEYHLRDKKHERPS